MTTIFEAANLNLTASQQMVKTDNTTHHLTPISGFPCSGAHLLAPPVPKYRTRTLNKFYPGFQSDSAPDAPVYFWHRSFVNRKVFQEYKLYYLLLTDI